MTYTEAFTPRVNSAIMQNFIEKNVRLPCKVKHFNEDGSMTVIAADEGEVIVKIASNHPSSETHLEIIGKVTGPTELRLLNSIPIEGPNIDLSVMNKTIKLIHDPRFFAKMFNLDDTDSSTA